MKVRAMILTLTVLLGLNAKAQSLPTDENGAIEYLEGQGVDIKQDADGRAARPMSSGQPPMTADESWEL